MSIGRALAQDGIERLETRAEAEQAGGYQLARFYQKFHHEYQNPTLEKLGYTIKEEQHGLKHMEKDGYSVVMAAAHEQADSLVQAAQSRQAYVNAEVEKVKAQTMSLVYQAQEAAEAAQMDKQRAEQARILAEQERAKVEAQTEEIKERTRAEANARAVELEWQLSQAQAYIAEQEGIIAKLRDKLEQVKMYLSEFNAIQHFYEWVMQFYPAPQEQDITPDDYETRSR